MISYIRQIGIGIVTCAMTVAVQGANLYGNSAGSNRIDVIDSNTGALIRSCSPAKGNGRGIVVVGNIAYHTVASSGTVFKFDVNTCADLGIAFTVAGASGLSTIAYDGTNFWIGDYSGTNKAYYYSPTGTLIKTITLSNCISFCDGLEFFNGKLISNRGDGSTGSYDIYDTNGTLLTPAFFTTTFDATGIAFDGTNFYVSSIRNAKVVVFSGTTGALLNTLTLTGGTGFLIEDLSFDYQVVLQSPDLTVTKTHSGSFMQGQVGATYTITVTNSGAGPTVGTVTMVDTLPAGLTPTSAVGSGWSCSTAGQVVTCTRNDALALAASYPPITVTVNVAATAPASVTNTATVSGGGESNTANNSASDVTLISAVATAPLLIPTISEWSLIALTGILMIAGFGGLRRRR